MWGLVLLVGCGSLLTACGAAASASTVDAPGMAGARSATALTKRPAPATGLGIAAGASACLEVIERDVHRAEQYRIAAAAGVLQERELGH